MPNRVTRLAYFCRAYPDSLCRAPQANARSVLGIGQPGETELDRLRRLSLHALTQRFENFAHSVLLQRVKSDSAGLAASLMELAALLQLHEAAHVIARITLPEAPRP